MAMTTTMESVPNHRWSCPDPHLLGVAGAAAAAVAVWAIAVPLLGVQLLVKFGAGAPQSVGVGFVLGASFLGSLAGLGTACLAGAADRTGAHHLDRDRRPCGAGVVQPPPLRGCLDLDQGDARRHACCRCGRPHPRHAAGVAAATRLLRNTRSWSRRSSFRRRSTAARTATSWQACRCHDGPQSCIDPRLRGHATRCGAAHEVPAGFLLRARSSAAASRIGRSVPADGGPRRQRRGPLRPDARRRGPRRPRACGYRGSDAHRDANGRSCCPSHSCTPRQTRSHRVLWSLRTAVRPRPRTRPCRCSDRR